MGKIIKLFLLFLLATVGHWAFASLFGHWEISVNLMLVFVVAVCAVVPPVWGYPFAFLGGLFLDFFSTKLFGANAFTFVLCACGVYSLAKRLDFGGFLPQSGVVFIGSFLSACLTGWLIWMFTSSIVWVGLGSVLAGAVIGAVCAPLIFWFVCKIFGNTQVQ